MLCRHPYVRDPSGKSIYRVGDPNAALDGVPFPCGQCLACRINRRRVWTARLLLERSFHDAASFITLTYSEENLPYESENYLPALCKDDLQRFWKRLRKRFGKKLRYFAVGEYGEKTTRPHYHAIVFGLSPFELDPFWMQFNGKSGYDRHSPLSRCWEYGIVHVGEATRESTQYVAGYCLKKLTKRDDSRQREFALMSRRPGIGLQAVDAILTAIKGSASPPSQIRINGQLWPVGRYLLHKLSEALGYDSVSSFLAEMRLRYRDFRQVHIDDAFFLDWMVEQDDQRFLQLDKRSKLFTVRDF